MGSGSHTPTEVFWEYPPGGVGLTRKLGVEEKSKDGVGGNFVTNVCSDPMMSAGTRTQPRSTTLLVSISSSTKHNSACQQRIEKRQGILLILVLEFQMTYGKNQIRQRPSHSNVGFTVQPRSRPHMSGYFSMRNIFLWIRLPSTRIRGIRIFWNPPSRKE